MNENNHDLLDISYNSDQFQVGSLHHSNAGLLEKCMAKQEKLQKSQNKNHSYEYISSYSSSTNSSGVPASIDSSAFSLNSSIDSSSSIASSSPSSPSLQSSYSTPDQDADYWLFTNGEQKQHHNGEEDYLNDAKYSNVDLCKRNSSLFAVRKSMNCNLKIAKFVKDQQENNLPLARSVRQTVNLVNHQQSTNGLKSAQKSAGYYASLHRGIIQPPSLQQFVYSDHANTPTSQSNLQTAQNNSATTKNNKSQVRRSRNGSGSSGMKCRRLYGMANKQSWCLQCRWKKVSISFF